MISIYRWSQTSQGVSRNKTPDFMMKRKISMLEQKNILCRECNFLPKLPLQIMKPYSNLIEVLLMLEISFIIGLVAAEVLPHCVRLRTED